MINAPHPAIDDTYSHFIKNRICENIRIYSKTKKFKKK